MQLVEVLFLCLSLQSASSSIVSGDGSGDSSGDGSGVGSVCAQLDTPFCFEVTGSPVEVSEGDGNVVLAVVPNDRFTLEPLFMDIKIYIRTQPNTAYPGQDYVSLDERMTLSSLQPFSVTVTILDDDILELTESFLVNLTVRYANLDGDPISTNSTVFVSIKDNDGLEAECSEYEIRLGSDDYSGSAAGLFTEEGSSELEVVSGRVELCVDGAWTSLCTDHWNFSSAAVACSQLGYPSIGAVATSYYNSDFVLNNNFPVFECTGQESSLSQCLESSLLQCEQRNSAGVICSLNLEPEGCEAGEVRFVGGANSLEGRLEVCVNEIWGTVCNVEWGDDGTDVVCAQALGQESSGSTDMSDSLGPIVLAGVYCNDNVTTLLDCGISDAEILAECSHYSDLQLQCSECNSTSDFSFLTTDESSDVFVMAQRRGQLLSCYDGRFSAVCSESENTFRQIEASVACLEFGYSQSGALAFNLSTDSSDVVSNVVIDSLLCESVDLPLEECLQGESVAGGCQYVAGIDCQAPTIGFSRNVYTVGESEGLFAVSVVLELPEPLPGQTVELEVLALDSTAIYGQDYVLLQHSVSFITQSTEREVVSAAVIEVLDNDRFDGNRNFTLELRVSTLITPLFVGTAMVVIEDDDCLSGEVRLVGGRRSDEGRVEVCEGGEWTTVCDDQWDYREATVVCNQLDLPADGAIAYGEPTFGSGVEPLEFPNFQCNGDEGRLVNCSSGKPDATCDSSHTAGVYCFPGVSPAFCPQNHSCAIAGKESSEGKIEISGKEFTCSPTYSAESIDFETTEIDTSFEANYMSPGSLLMLRQFDVISRDEGTIACNVSTPLQPYGDPTTVLRKLGVETITLVYLEGGRFNSLVLTLPELQSVVVSEDYSVQAILNEESSQSLHWLMYFLTLASSLPPSQCRHPFQDGTTVISFDVNCG